MKRRTWLASCAALVACPDEATLDFEQLPEQARDISTGLGLGEGAWAGYRNRQQRMLAQRIDEGSAEHVVYYVLQSRRFTKQPSIDPVRLAASKPTEMPLTARQRFADFVATSLTDERHKLVVNLFRALPRLWTAEACFAHTMDFLAARSANREASRDALYQRRGLSSDTTPSQTRVIDQALKILGTRPKGNILLAGPGLDLTRREAFSDDTPLRIYQVERLLLTGAPLDCVDLRPEVLANLKQYPVCAQFLDISTMAASGTGRYHLAVATNVFIYLDDRALFAAMAGMMRSLAPGGYLVHNDTRYATKAFGEALGMPVVYFAPVSLGKRQGVELMDRVVIHRKRRL